MIKRRKFKRMKVIRDLKRSRRKQQITIQINPRILDDLKAIQKEHEIARQALIEAILDKALKDTNFMRDLLPS